MYIKNIESKIKLALIISVLSLTSSIVIVALVLIHANNLIKDEREQVYVLDAGIPLLVQRSSLEENQEVEGMSHVNMFHSLFFNLPPDEKFISDNITKAMYLIDESGMKLYKDMREQQVYNQIVVNGMILSVKADSIHYNTNSGEFNYYGTQRIERPTSITRRRLISQGRLKRIKRSENNPHGFIIYDYKIINNEDIENRSKQTGL